MVEQQADKKNLENRVEAVVPHRRNIWQHWPTGLTAFAVIVFSWFGIYLLWRGIAPIFGF